MTSDRKSILTATLGHLTASALAQVSLSGTPHDIQATIAASIIAANKAGFDIYTFEVNPQDIEVSLSRLKEQLQSQHWDGLLIGFAIRGEKESTPLFEGLVDVCRQAAPGTKLLFGSGPYDLMATLRRNF